MMRDIHQNRLIAFDWINVKSTMLDILRYNACHLNITTTITGMMDPIGSLTVYAAVGF